MFPTPEILERFAAPLAALMQAAARWGPALPVAGLAALALLQALILPQRWWAKAAWVSAVVLCSAGAAALLHWHEQGGIAAASDRVGSETTALKKLWEQWDAISKSLPAPPGEPPAANFDSVDDAVASLSAKAATVDTQIAAFKASIKARSVDSATALKLADYLRQSGSYRVVVSCAPDDLEAYNYANQIAKILRSAGWDANGPEATAMDGKAMGISISVRNPASPDAARILMDAFSRYNIPYQTGIAENDAIPDATTVELYVAKKP